LRKVSNCIYSGSTILFKRFPTSVNLPSTTVEKNIIIYQSGFVRLSDLMNLAGVCMKLLKQVLVRLTISIFTSLLFNPVFNAQQLSNKQITFIDSTHYGYPYWSPDGNRIVFSSSRERRWAIWIM
jgi:hypothetical protein